MAEPLGWTARRHRRLRSTRKIRLVLACVGWTALVLGVALFALAAALDNPRLRRAALAYVAGSLVVLIGREFFVQWDRYRKRKYRPR